MGRSRVEPLRAPELSWGDIYRLLALAHVHGQITGKNTERSDEDMQVLAAEFVVRVKESINGRLG